jgi:hypothetical protein
LSWLRVVGVLRSGGRGAAQSSEEAQSDEQRDRRENAPSSERRPSAWHLFILAGRATRIG